MSTIGQSTSSGAAASPACFIGLPRRKLLKRSVKEVEDDAEAAGAAAGRLNTLSPDEQPASTSRSPSAAKPRGLRQVLFGIIPCMVRRYIKPTVAAPRLAKGATAKFRLRRARPLLRIVPEPREQQVVMPRAVDAQILAGIALAREAGALEEADGSRIGRDAGGLDAVQPQRREGEGQDRLDRRRHMTAAHEGLAHPIAETAGLGDAAPHARERQPADQHVILLAEDEEGVGLVRAPILGIALETAAERRAG